MAEDVLAREGYGLMVSAEVLGADVACVGGVQLGVKEVLHGYRWIETCKLSR